MRLKAPTGTTDVRSPHASYPLDDEACIEVPDGHEDVQLFQGLGFQPVNDNPLVRPARAKNQAQA